LASDRLASEFAYRPLNWS